MADVNSSWPINFDVNWQHCNCDTRRWWSRSSGNVSTDLNICCTFGFNVQVRVETGNSNPLIFPRIENRIGSKFGIGLLPVWFQSALGFPGIEPSIRRPLSIRWSSTFLGDGKYPNLKSIFIQISIHVEEAIIDRQDRFIWKRLTQVNLMKSLYPWNWTGRDRFTKHSVVIVKKTGTAALPVLLQTRVQDAAKPASLSKQKAYTNNQSLIQSNHSWCFLPQSTRFIFWIRAASFADSADNESLNQQLMEGQLEIDRIDYINQLNATSGLI